MLGLRSFQRVSKISQRRSFGKNLLYFNYGQQQEKKVIVETPTQFETPLRSPQELTDFSKYADNNIMYINELKEQKKKALEAQRMHANSQSSPQEINDFIKKRSNNNFVKNDINGSSGTTTASLGEERKVSGVNRSGETILDKVTSDDSKVHGKGDTIVEKVTSREEYERKLKSRKRTGLTLIIIGSSLLIFSAYVHYHKEKVRDIFQTQAVLLEKKRKELFAPSSDSNNGRSAVNATTAEAVAVETENKDPNAVMVSRNILQELIKVSNLEGVDLTNPNDLEKLLESLKNLSKENQKLHEESENLRRNLIVASEEAVLALSTADRRLEELDALKRSTAAVSSKSQETNQNENVASDIVNAASATNSIGNIDMMNVVDSSEQQIKQSTASSSSMMVRPEEVQIVIDNMKTNVDGLIQEISILNSRLEHAQASLDQSDERHLEELEKVHRDYLQMQDDLKVSFSKTLSELKEKHQQEISRNLQEQENQHREKIEGLIKENEAHLKREFQLENLGRVEEIAKLTDKVDAVDYLMKRQLEYVEDSLKVQKLGVIVQSLQNTLQTNAPFLPEVQLLKDEFLPKTTDNMKLQDVSVDRAGVSPPLSSTTVALAVDPLIEGIVNSISFDMAVSGVMTVPQLEESFQKIKKKALTVSYIRPDGLLGQVLSRAISTLTFEESDVIPSDSTDYYLCRAGNLLKQNHLKEALVMVDMVKNQDSREVLANWRTQARRRLFMDQNLKVLQSHLLNLYIQIQ